MYYEALNDRNDAAREAAAAVPAEQQPGYYSVVPDTGLKLDSSSDGH